MSVHGTARFATRKELRAKGLIGDGTVQPNGLMIGWWRESAYDFEPIVYDGDLHQLIVGGTGGGKFTTAIAPLLLGSGLEDSTVVVVDPKGEIANLAGPFFQKAFAEKPSVFLLDPWDVCETGATAGVNVLDVITPDNPNYVDDARALADAMIIPSGGENTHWDNTARNFLAGIILYVALKPEEKDRDLVRARQIVARPWAMPAAYKGPKKESLSDLVIEHMASDLADGALAHAFTGLMNREEKERSGIISSIERDTTWIDSPPMKRILRGACLDLKQAALGGGKYFVVMHPDYAMTHRAWLRLMVTAFSKAMKRYQPAKDQPQHSRWRHIVIDEFATLGEMSFVLNDVAIARGFAIKYHLAVQDLAQLDLLYRQGWHTFINSSFQRFFAVGDLFTADQVSKLTGAATVESISESESKNVTRSVSESGVSASVSSSETWSVSQVQRPLLTSDEVRRLDGSVQLIFFRGMHPIWCWRPPYWKIFPSLPSFGLKAILGTVGRAPQDEAERASFTAWREAPLLMRPEALSPPRPMLSLPLEPREPEWLPWRMPVAIGAVVLMLILSWFAAPALPTW